MIIKDKGSITKKGNKWYVIIDLPREKDGERNQKWFGGFKTKEKAEEERIRINYEINQGIHINPNNITLGEFMDEWLEEVASNNIRESSFKRYKSLTENHIKPTLGDIELQALKPIHIQKKIISEKLKSGNLKTGEGLSAETINMILNIIHGALDTAVKWEMVVKNVAKLVDRPRVEKKEMDYLDPDQVKVFLKEAKKDEGYYPILLTAVMTGLRRGELLGLRWKDVNFTAKQIAIRKSLTRRDSEYVLTEPKSDSSIRTVAVPSIVIKTFKKERKKQAERELKYEGGYNEKGLIFTKKDGSFIHPNTLTRHYKKILKKANLPEIRFHDLRHTHATLMLSQGEEPKVISERLGHSTISITLDRYSHVLPNMQQEAADRLENELFS